MLFKYDKFEVSAGTFCPPGRIGLRSSSELLLGQPRTKTLVTLGDRSFELAAPTLWNSLPAEIRKASSVEVFKRMLKTCSKHWEFR